MSLTKREQEQVDEARRKADQALSEAKNSTNMLNQVLEAVENTAKIAQQACTETAVTRSIAVELKEQNRQLFSRMRKQEIEQASLKTEHESCKNDRMQGPAKTGNWLAGIGILCSVLIALGSAVGTVVMAITQDSDEKKLNKMPDSRYERNREDSYKRN